MRRAEIRRPKATGAVAGGEAAVRGPLRHGYSMSPTQGQATKCPADISCSAGVSAVHPACANSQRAANLQPGGGSMGLVTSPRMIRCRVLHEIGRAHV